MISLILLLTFVLGQLGRLTIFRSDLIININDLAITIVTLIYFIIKIFKKEKIHFPGYSGIILFFIISAILSGFINLKSFTLINTVIGSFYLVRFFIYFLFSVAISNYLRKKQEKTEFVIKILIYTGLVYLLIAFGQYLFYPDLTGLEKLGWDPHLYRLAGTLLDPNFTGLVICLSLIVISNFLFYKQNIKRTEKFIFYISLIIGTIAVALTYSRATYLTFLISFFLLIYLRFKKRFMLLAVSSIFIFGLIILLIPKGKSYGTDLLRQLTVQARIANYKSSLTVFKKNWLFGVGFNNFRYALIKYNLTALKDSLTSHAAGSDNSLLFILATTGIIGTVIYFYFWGLILKEIRKFKPEKSDNSKKIINNTLLISLTAVFTQSFFINALFYSYIMEWLWVLISLKEATKENI